MSKRAHVVEVRPVNDQDSEAFRTHVKWVAVDSHGFKFGGDTEEEARKRAEEYNTPVRRHKEPR